MCSQRKKILIQLALLEAIIAHQRKQGNLHKNILLALLYRQRVALISLVLPVFLWRLKKGGSKGLIRLARQVMKLGVMASISHIKKQLLLR